MNFLHEIVLPSLRDLAAQSAKASLLAFAVALLCLLPRRWLSSPWRHVLWCAVFVRLILPDVPVPGWSWNFSRLLPDTIASAKEKSYPFVPSNVPLNVDVLTAFSEPSPSAPVARASVLGRKTDNPESTAAIPGTAVRTQIRLQPNRSWSGVLVSIWLVGAVAWWVALAGAWWRFRRRVLAGASDVAPQVQALLTTCLGEAGVRTRVQLRYSDHLAVPAVCGVARPVILIPRALESGLSAHKLRLLLLHELGHVKRRDTLVQMAASLLLGMHWWNPVLWIAWSRLRREAEVATDDWVLRRTGPDTAPTYGALLLDLASHACAVGLSLLWVPSLIGATSQGRRLRQRLAAIVGHRPATLRATLLSGATLLIVAMAGFSQDTPAPKTSPTPDPVAGQSDPVVHPSVSLIGGLIVDEQGQPIEGAKIEVSFSRPYDRQVKSILPEAGKRSERVESDLEGRWHLDGVPIGVEPLTYKNGPGKDTYRLYITHPEYLFADVSSTVPDYGSDASFRNQTATLTLKRGHAMRGTVRDEQGKGLAGATLERLTLNHGADPKATADADGKYELKTARPGDFAMRVRARGFALLLQRVVLFADQTVDFTLKPAKTLTLKIRDEQGRPVTKGLVNFKSVAEAKPNSDRLWSAKPGEDGRVTWDEAPEDEVVAEVRMVGYLLLDQKVRVGEETTLVLRPIPPPPVIMLKVTSARTGRPLPGCTIDTGIVLRQFPKIPQEAPAPPRPMWTISHATVKAGAVEGDYAAHVREYENELLMFRVRCEGHVPVMTAPVDPKNGNATIALSLQERPPTTITVTKEDGSPVANAGVHVAWTRPSVARKASSADSNISRLVEISVNRSHPEFSGTTDTNGRCILPACADNASVVVANETGVVTAAYADLMENGTMKLQPYRDGEAALFKRMLPPASGELPPGRLHVRVMYEGKPVPAKTVYTIACGDQPDDLATVHTSFLRDGLHQQSFATGTRNLQVGWRTPEGTHCFSPAFSTQIKSGEAREVTASLKPGIRLAGRVADEMPRPVKDAQVLVFVSAEFNGPLNKLTWSDSTPVREDGSFEFHSLPPGYFRFLVVADSWMSPLEPRADGGRIRIWSAGLISQSRDGLVIPMQPTATCEVTVLDASGGPASGAAVMKSLSFTTDGFQGWVLFFNDVRGFMLSPPANLQETLSGKTYLPKTDEVKSIYIFTDAQGHATLRGLPPLFDVGKVLVIAPGLDFPNVRNASASAPVGILKPGEATKVTVRLEK